MVVPKNFDIEHGKEYTYKEAEEFNFSQLGTGEVKEMVDYLILTTIDLSQIPINELDEEAISRLSRPAFMFEQFAQAEIHDLLLGHGRLHRIPGAGNWNVGRGCFTIFLTYCTSNRDKYREQIGASIANANGKPRLAVVKGEYEWSGKCRLI